jgi:hypothetical protein
VPPIVHALWPVRVVALGNLPNPGAGVAGTLGDGGRRLAFGQQLHDLPPRPFVWLVGRSVP